MDRPAALPEIPPSRLRLLYELACAFAARLELDALITLVVEKCREVFDAEGASVLLHDRASDELYFPFVVSDDPGVAAKLSRLRFPARQGIAGSVLESGRSQRIDDASADARIFRGADDRTRTRTRSLLCAPLITRDGTIGVLEVVNHRAGTPFVPEDLSFLETLAGSVAVAIENARLYAALRDSESRLKVEVEGLRRNLAREDRFTEIVGTSSAMAAVFELMEAASATPLPVLIEGEAGVGKELVARGIHKASARARHPFHSVSCAALPEALLDGELFGYRRGSFPGATQDHMGLLEAARGGTILLDEVGGLSTALQTKLLRALESGDVLPLGESRAHKIDARVIATTTRDLAADVARGSFLRELYERIATCVIRVPPLRDRREDIEVIAAWMLDKLARRTRKEIPGLSADAARQLLAHDWPENVRELRREIERAASLVRSGEAVTPRHLSAKLAVCANVA